VESAEFTAPRKTYVLSGGESEFLQRMKYVASRLTPSSLSLLGRELCRFVDIRGPAPTLPFFVGVPLADAFENVQLSHTTEVNQTESTLPQTDDHRASTPQPEPVHSTLRIYPGRPAKRRCVRPKKETTREADGRRVYDMAETCGICLRYESPGEDQSVDNWIQCENCPQWYHWDCVYVPGVEEEITCTRCSFLLTLNEDEN